MVNFLWHVSRDPKKILARKVLENPKEVPENEEEFKKTMEKVPDYKIRAEKVREWFITLLT